MLLLLALDWVYYVIIPPVDEFESKIMRPASIKHLPWGLRSSENVRTSLSREYQYFRLQDFACQI